MVPPSTAYRAFLAPLGRAEAAVGSAVSLAMLAGAALIVGGAVDLGLGCVSAAAGSAATLAVLGAARRGRDARVGSRRAAEIEGVGAKTVPPRRGGAWTRPEAGHARELALTHAAFDAIVTLRSSGRVETFNPSAERAFAMSGVDATGLDFRTLVDLHGRPNETFLDMVGFGDPGLATAPRPAIARRADGVVFPVEVVFAAFTEGPEIQILAVIHDVSETFRAERLHEEFVSAATHEFQTPLISLTSTLGLLRSGAVVRLPKNAADLVDVAHAASEQLSGLVADLVDMERIASGRARFSPARFDLREVFQTTMLDLAATFRAAEVRVTTVGDGRPVWAMGDRSRMGEVATRLLDNARRCSPAGGVVRVAFAERAGVVQVSVQDDGPVIPGEARSRMFSRSAQVEASGAGREGLAICKEIVDRHEGEIFYTSLPGRGTRFYVNLPAAAPASTSGGGPRAVGAPGVPVLICEGDPQVGEVLQAAVRAQGGAPKLVYSLGQARAALASGRYDIVLLDARLPDGDGLELLTALPHGGEDAPTPMIILSADEPREVDSSAPVHVVGWLKQPVRPDALRRLLKTAFGEVRGVSAPARPVILHVDDDADICRLVNDLLKPIGEVVHAESLVQARRMLAEVEPALVVLDLSLGDGSGLELLPFLSDKRGARIPTIVFSGRLTEGDLTGSVTKVLPKSRASLEALAVQAHLLIEGAALVTPTGSEAV